jgi:hypothetical protein
MFGADPIDQPGDAGVGARGMLLRQSEHLVRRRQFRSEIGFAGSGPAETACRFDRSVLVSRNGGFRLVFLGIERKLVEIHLARYECLGGLDRRGRLPLLDHSGEAFPVHVEGARRRRSRTAAVAAALQTRASPGLLSAAAVG